MLELPILSLDDTLSGAPAFSGGCSSDIALALDGSVAPRRRLPPWLKRPLPTSEMSFTSQVIEDLRLETVCESAKCPNRTECWSHRTATFMILGNVCTRPCGFCRGCAARPPDGPGRGEVAAISAIGLIWYTYIAAN